MKPTIISTEKVYEGHIFDVSTSKIREGEIEYEREIVEHSGSVVIVPVFPDQTVALVRQYRHAAREYLLEIPAGTLEKGENPETGARRELEEEIGVTTEKIKKLSEFYVSPGFLTEKMHLYLAVELTHTQQRLESDELIEIVRISFGSAFEEIKNGAIKDAKTIIGLTLAGAKFGLTIND